MNCMKVVSIGFLGNLNYDTRTYNLFKSLKSHGFEVIFNGFDWMTSGFQSIAQPDVHITKLIKRKFSLIFYGKFMLSLFRQLLQQKPDIYFASDLYALPVCIIAAGIQNGRVFYDSREIYTELTGIKFRVLVKRLFCIIEKYFIQRADLVFTTGDMDSNYLERLYKFNNFNYMK